MLYCFDPSLGPINYVFQVSGEQWTQEDRGVALLLQNHTFVKDCLENYDLYIL